MDGTRYQLTVETTGLRRVTSRYFRMWCLDLFSRPTKAQHRTFPNPFGTSRLCHLLTLGAGVRGSLPRPHHLGTEGVL